MLRPDKQLNIFLAVAHSISSHSKSAVLHNTDGYFNNTPRCQFTHLAKSTAIQYTTALQ